MLLLAATGTLLLREQDFSSLVKSVQSAPVREQSLRHAAKERGLSQRELSVFLLLVEGKETTEIGSELFIAQSTVRAHISRIYEKLGVHSRQELRQLAEGMVDMRAEP